jgi:hypothetical protein
LTKTWVIKDKILPSISGKKIAAITMHCGGGIANNANWQKFKEESNDDVLRWRYCRQCYSAAIQMRIQVAPPLEATSKLDFWSWHSCHVKILKVSEKLWLLGTRI